MGAAANGREVETQVASEGSGFWAGWSTRARLIVTVLAIDLVAALVFCAVIVFTARSAVEVEMRATIAAVEPIIHETMASAGGASPRSLLQALDLRLQALRHVRVVLQDTEGGRIGFTPAQARRAQRQAPGWFVRLIAPAPLEYQVPITVGEQRVGTALVKTEPLDEIEEDWGYARSLFLASLLLNLSVLIALYLALGRLLKPLQRFGDGLTQLEHHDYTVRLPPPTSRELSLVAERFNRVASALSEARAANIRLNRQLLTAQDDERRRTALELHDEFGPCLFALEANAASIVRLAEGAASLDRARLAARAEDIRSIVGQVQLLNRDLLNRLRPHALGQVPLAECLNLLVRDFARRHPGARFEASFEGLARTYGDLVDLTVFRCLQESMTNAVRHAGATRIEAIVREETERRTEAPAGEVVLHICVRDDGSGLVEGHRTGLGLSGMRERVGALDGTFALDKADPGTVVRIKIPIEPQPEGDAVVSPPSEASTS